MRPDVSIDGTSMASRGWLRESIDFPVPQSQTQTVTIPGRDSPIRFSIVQGRISWQPRTFKIVLTRLCTHQQLLESAGQLAASYAGRLCQVSITELAGLYASGTLQMSSSYDSSTHKGSLTISCSDADAWWYHQTLTQVTQKGSGTLVLENDAMPTVPSITCTAQTQLDWYIGTDAFTKSLEAGTWTVPELELQAGENSVIITTEGDTTFSYREGRL